MSSRGCLAWGFWADGFCLVARVRTKDKVCNMEGTKFAKTKLAVADSIRVCVASVFGGECVAREYMCCLCVPLLEISRDFYGWSLNKSVVQLEIKMVLA